MPIPSPAFARYRLQWLLLGLSLLLLLLALQHAFHQVTELNKRDTINAATHFSSQYQRMEAFLEAMRGQAEERLRTDPRSVLSHQLYQALQVDGEHGITLDRIPVGLPPALIGNLTGLSPRPPADSQREARMHLALSLSPLLATASKLLGKEAAWIYFTGKDNFIYLYPWVPSSQFRFSPLIYNTAYWQEALTQLSPSEHAILSRPYQDLAGQGRMVTLSQPITQTGEITGLISIDIETATLAQTLRRLAPQVGTLFLVNAHQQILASSQSGTAPPLTRQAQQEAYHWQQGALQLTHTIPGTPLTLIHRIALLPLLQILLWESATALLTVLCLVIATLSGLHVRRLNQRLNYLSRHDALTGAFNRHYFDAFEHSHAEAGTRQIGAIMFDCDHFKQVNDRFGHEVGDEVLIRLVALCHTLLPRECHLIRWGGEEFLLLVTDRRLPLAPLAERLRLAIEAHPWSDIAPDLRVTVSLGHCRQSQAATLQEAIRRADLALYQAKAKGRNRSEGWRDDGQEQSG